MNCVEDLDHSLIKLEENRRKAIFRNPNRVPYRKGKIDGCLVKAESKKPDYFISGEGKTVLVELKGCDVAHACKQLLEAVEHKKIKPYLKGKIGFLIICSRYPSHDTTIQIAIAKIRNKYKTKLFVFCDEREVEMSIF